MFTERLLSQITASMIKNQLQLHPTSEAMLPSPEAGKSYMLYMHVPFCEVLCPYCSFNRYPFHEDVARPYFKNLRREMKMVKELGYNIETIYFGGGTPTVMIDELCKTIDFARDIFDIKEISAETNPNHLIAPMLEKMKGRIQRLSVGVQSFNNDLLKQMDRYKKYGSGEEIMERIAEAIPYFTSLNVDMIFNFPSQTEDVLIDDLEKVSLCGSRQVTFSPLYKSNATMKKLMAALGKIDYEQEYRYYQILDGVLAGGNDPLFERETLWTFNRREPEGSKGKGLLVEEYAVSYEEYPAIGSGAITPLNHTLYVNTFSLAEYNEAIESGRMSLMGNTKVGGRNFERYWFLLQLYHLHLDKKAFREKFGIKLERALPAEMAFLRMNRAFEIDDENELTLTPFGRYLVVVMYRQFLSGLNNLREQARSKLTGAESVLQFEGEHWDVADSATKDAHTSPNGINATGSVVPNPSC